MRSRRRIAAVTAAAAALLAFQQLGRSADWAAPAPGTPPDPGAPPLPPAESPSHMVVPPARDTAAAAQDTTPRGRPYQPPSRVGVALTVGGGVAEFVGGNIRANTSTAGFWDVRVAAGTRQWVGLEAAYVGAAQTIRGLGLTQQGTLLRNGAEGALRVNAPLTVRAALVEPYVFGGVGWNHYSISSASPTASLRASDDVLTVPCGAGLSAGYRGVLVDARFTYRPTFREGLLHESGDDGLTNWSAGAQIGYEF
jgi:hypothetical protein